MFYIKIQLLDSFSSVLRWAICADCFFLSLFVLFFSFSFLVKVKVKKSKRQKSKIVCEFATTTL